MAGAAALQGSGSLSSVGSSSSARMTPVCQLSLKLRLRPAPKLSVPLLPRPHGERAQMMRVPPFSGQTQLCRCCLV